MNQRATVRPNRGGRRPRLHRSPEHPVLPCSPGTDEGLFGASQVIKQVSCRTPRNNLSGRNTAADCALCCALSGSRQRAMAISFDIGAPLCRRGVAAPRHPDELAASWPWRRKRSSAGRPCRGKHAGEAVVVLDDVRSRMRPRRGQRRAPVRPATPRCPGGRASALVIHPADRGLVHSTELVVISSPAGSIRSGRRRFR